MTDAFTISKMLQNMNDLVGNTGDTAADRTISLKRKLENGIILNTSAQEIAYLDTQSNVKHGALQVAQLAHREDHYIWMDRNKALANDAFRAGDFVKAADIFMQTLAGLDFGKTEEEKQICVETYQIPITCNVISCMLVTQQWKKAKQMCDVVIALNAFHIKALKQRAKAHMKLGLFDVARSDLEKAAASIQNQGSNQIDDSLTKGIQHQLRDIDYAERKERIRSAKQRQFSNNMMLKAAGKLYEDKQDPPPGRDSDNVQKLTQSPMSKTAILATILLMIACALAALS